MGMVGSLICTDLLHGLSQGKVFPTDQWFMGTFYHDPVLGVNPTPEMHFITDGPGKLLGHVPLVHRMTQDAADGLSIPEARELAAFVCHLLMSRRGGNLLPIENLGNLGPTGAAQE